MKRNTFKLNINDCIFHCKSVDVIRSLLLLLEELSRAMDIIESTYTQKCVVSFITWQEMKG